MLDDSSDILGGPILSVPPTGRTSTWASLSFVFRTAFALILLFFGLVAFRQARDAFLKWQERGHRLATRRRYGIPDTDHRPFTVAHAAVLRARQEREAQERLKQQSVPANDITTETQAVRQRFHDTAGQRNTGSAWLIDPQTNTAASAADHFRAQSTSFNFPGALPADPLNFADRYHPNPPSIHTVAPAPVSRHSPSKRFGPSRGSSRLKLNIMGDANEDSKKRSLDDEDDAEPVKKTRVEGEELIDGDEDAGWQQDTDKKVREKRAERQPQRGAKRVLGDDDAETKRTRDKRPRKQIGDHVPKKVNQVIIDEESDPDNITMRTSGNRGRKRDRVEAGSTLAGDGEHSGIESEGEEEKKIRQRMKRRTLTKRKSEVHSRGRKRDRDPDSFESEDEEDEGPSHSHASRKKRGKKLSEDEGYQGSDVSMDGSQTSQDPHCNGRRIGDEWEVNGVLYKVGPNGDRLRQELVKKARSKFVMPKDSQHPDRQANLEVFVEVWLTEDEYNEAKDRQQLAWQDPPKSQRDTETSVNVPESPTKVGKDLLWSVKPKDGSVRRPLFRQSIATNLGLRINPFQQSLAGSGRRVASAIASDSTGSPKGAYRSFSKWEKQDLEAEAMAKLRVQRKAVTPEKKPGESCSATPLPTVATPAAPFSLPKPQEKPPQTAENKPAQTISFGVPPAASDASKSDVPRNPVAVNLQTPKPSFTPPPSTTPAGIPPRAMNATASNADASAAIPTITLTPPSAKPPAPTAPSPAPPPTNPSLDQGTSNPFGPKPPSGLPSAAPSPQPSNASKPAPFGFSAPPTNTNPAAPQFSFGSQVGKTPFAAASPDKPQPEQGSGSTAGGSSLMNRLGGFAAPQSSQPPAPGPSSKPLFPKPAPTSSTQTPKPSSGFELSTTPTNTPPAASSASSAPGTGGAGFKFNFGFNKKPASNTLGTAPITTSAPSAESSNPPPPQAAVTPFGFNSTKPATSPKPTDPPKSTSSTFGFGSSSGTAFTTFSGNSGPTAFQASSAPTTTAKPEFGGLGGANTGAGLASQTNATTTPSPFGSGSVANAAAQSDQKSSFSFGSGSSSTAKPAGTNSSFSFGGASASKPSGTSSAFSIAGAASSIAKPADTASAFSFGNAAPSLAVKPTETSSAFSFGNAASSTAKPAESNPFSFGTPSNNAAPKTTFSFGQNSTSPAVPNPPPAGDQKKPEFSFMGAASATSSQPPASMFGAQPNSQSVFGKSAMPSPSAFGFGSASSNTTTTFGAPSGSTGQQS